MILRYSRWSVKGTPLGTYFPKIASLNSHSPRDIKFRLIWIEPVQRARPAEVAAEKNPSTMRQRPFVQAPAQFLWFAVPKCDGMLRAAKRRGIYFSLSRSRKWKFRFGSAAMDWHQAIDTAEKIFTILAIIGGASWAYFHYFKGRTYRPRLEPKVGGKVFVREGVRHLIATAELKNTGLSKLEIMQVGTALRVLAGRPTQKATAIERARLCTLPVFEAHRWIEPGETIREQVLVGSATDRQIAFKMDLRIVSSGLEWNTMAIVEVPARARSEGGRPCIRMKWNRRPRTKKRLIGSSWRSWKTRRKKTKMRLGRSSGRKRMRRISGG